MLPNWFPLGRRLGPAGPLRLDGQQLFRGLIGRSPRKALEDKARQGVQVAVLLPNQNADEKLVRWAGQRVYQELLEAGVKIHEYQPHLLQHKTACRGRCVMGPQTGTIAAENSMMK